MDILFFLQERLSFVRRHYDVSVAAFEDSQRRIEAEEPPFHEPPFSEDGEPPYLAEWLDAQSSIDVTGLLCISLLSDALKLYLNMLHHRTIGFSFDENERNRLKRAFVATYRDALGETFDTDWRDSGVDFAIIEQVVLARNRGQHGTDLTTFLVEHDASTLGKHPRPFFMRAEEAATMDKAASGHDTEPALSSFVNPTLAVTRETLFAATDEVEGLAVWIEANMDRAARWRKAQMSRRSST